MVTTEQQIWLNIAGLVNSCPAPTGAISPTSVGRFRLGMTRASALRLGRNHAVRYGFDRYCLSSGAIRVTYATHTLLRSAATRQHGLTSGVIMVLTSSRHYAIDGVRTHTSIAAARRSLPLGPSIVVGKNAWYLVHAGRAEWVFKVQHGVIGEIGITDPSLTSTAAERAYLLRHL